MGVLVKFIREFNDVLGLISIVVIYDVIEVFIIVDYIYILVDKCVIGEGIV